ncbi:hypothetical protein N7462_007234 [Penicillium macrosclerotiorum]|uniref:uncharacterized protein n=1 Tax=Penicillium macrosclerotiorum TaxID=303699 RepID=UPI002547F623|nr:uncharacterized protein N7462_007234 [Penicillium macrosclerotiorum]KAJ5678990.1 hypothetical protein N7462_007234 [Penicillium macrosclerotiorum]
MANITAAGDGITGGYTGQSLGMQITIATLAGITWYNAFELVVLIFVTFALYRGLYFWSLLVSSIGLVPYSLGFLMKFFNLTTATWLPVTFLTIGWWTMVTGQSIVLYSRLHLVLANQRVLRRVLIMILVNAVALHIPTTVLTYGTNLAPAGGPRNAYIRGYNVMEKIQMTGFCLQEFIISGLYIWETVRMIRLDPDRTKRKIQYQLIIINMVIIILDLGLLVAEYRNYYIMETMLKGAVYSIKLKLEFAVLGKLIHLVHNHVWKPESFSAPGELPDFVDATRVTSDLTHAAPTSSHRGPNWMDADDISIAMFEHSPQADPNATSDWSSETRIHYTEHHTIDFTNHPCQYQRKPAKLSEKPG